MRSTAVAASRVRAWCRVSPILAVCVIAGCYSFAPGQLVDAGPGQPIRLRVTAQEAERLAPMRLTEDRYVEGVLVSRSGQEVLVDTRVGVTNRQQGGRVLTQRINIPVSEVQDVEFRRRDHVKTAAAVAAVGVGVGIGIAAAFGGGRGEREGEGDPVVELRRGRPAFQLQVPLSTVLRATR